MTLAGNPVLSVPGGEHLSKALFRLDFMVSVDFYINETTRHAHAIRLSPSSGSCPPDKRGRRGCRQRLDSFMNKGTARTP